MRPLTGIIIIYINKIIQEFKTVVKKGIQLTNRKLVNAILYADDQILMATSEDDLKQWHTTWTLQQENIKWPYLVQKQNQWQCMETTYRG